MEDAAIATQDGDGLGRTLLNGWMAIAVRFGFVQTTMFLFLFYVLMLGPVSLGLIVARRDYLGRRGLRAGTSAWREADTAAPDLERAKLLS